MILSFEVPDGLEMPMGDETKEFIGRLLIAHIDDFQPLFSGTYDITPDIWTKNTYLHKLTVLFNGQGIYRLIPRFPNVGIAVPHANDRLVYEHGGSEQYINQQFPTAIVAGGNPTKPGVHLYRAICYLDLSDN